MQPNIADCGTKGALPVVRRSAANGDKVISIRRRVDATAVSSFKPPSDWNAVSSPVASQNQNEDDGSPTAFASPVRYHKGVVLSQFAVSPTPSPVRRSEPSPDEICFPALDGAIISGAAAANDEATRGTSKQASPGASDRLNNLVVTARHPLSYRGMPIEFTWTVGIDNLLRLRARPIPAGTTLIPPPALPQNDDVSNTALVSAPIHCNGLPLSACLSRAQRQQETSGLKQSNSSKPFENHLVAFHLISPEMLPANDADQGAAPRCSNSDDADEIRIIEQRSWERKVSLMAEIKAVTPTSHYDHPMLKGACDKNMDPNRAMVPRLRRVMEGTLSASHRTVGFSMFIPLRELLLHYLESDSDPQSSSSSVFFTLNIKVFVSNGWNECLRLHSVHASNSRKLYNLVGLRNHGSTCYVNVLMQALFHIAPFRRETMQLTAPGRRKSEAALQLQRIFAQLEVSSTPVDTMALLKAIKINPSVQNDSHEFLSEFFLHRVLKNVVDLFSFRVKYLTTCDEVDFSSSSEDTLYELSLVAGTKYPSLESAIAKELSKEEMSDLYDTGVPHLGKQKACRQMHIVTFPHILFVHSKRFDHYAKKVHTTQTFPLKLEYFSGHPYYLHSVIVHHGTGVNSGHFTSYVRVSKSERGISDPSAPSHQFFHFDDEAVTPATDMQVSEEVVGVHWMSPSSSAYILIYIEADYFEEATTQFDPVPEYVKQGIAALDDEKARNLSVRTPPPIPRSPPPPSPRNSDRAASPCQKLKPQKSDPPYVQPFGDISGNTPSTVPDGGRTPPTAALQLPASIGNDVITSSATKRRTTVDPSDLTRIMSACREMTARSLRLLPRSECRTVVVTVWTVAGLRDCMTHLGVVHDLLDLRYAAKYLRQERSMMSLPPPSSATLESGAFVWGSGMAAVELRVTPDTTLSELRMTALSQLSRKKNSIHTHFSADGVQLSPPEDFVDTYTELMLFKQRQNGTWRPSIPIFHKKIPVDDNVHEDVESPSVFATPSIKGSPSMDYNSTNISGTFTVRRRMMSAAMKDLEASGRTVYPPPDLSVATQDTTIADVLAMDDDASSGTDRFEVHLLATAAVAHRLPLVASTVSPTSLAATPAMFRSASNNSNTRYPPTHVSQSLQTVEGERGCDVIPNEADDNVLGSGSITSIPPSGVNSRVGSLVRMPISAAAHGSGAIGRSVADIPIVGIERTGLGISARDDCWPIQYNSSNSSLLMIKTFQDNAMGLCGSFYVPWDWPLLRLVHVLFYGKYLDWALFPAQEYSVHYLESFLHTFAAGDNSALGTAAGRQYLADLQSTLHIFEEVRPERLDELSDWVNVTIYDLELGHGDILIVSCSTYCPSPLPRHATVEINANDTIHHSQLNFSSSDDDDHREGGSPGRERRSHAEIIARALLSSLRTGIVACTLLAPLFAIGASRPLIMGDTIFVLVDYHESRTPLDDVIEAKLQQLAYQSQLLKTSVAYELPNNVASSPLKQPLAEALRVRWWAIEPNLNNRQAALYTATNESQSTSLKLLQHKVRTLRYVAGADLSSVAHAVEKVADSAVNQVGTLGAPLNILSAMFPSVSTALLQFGSFVLGSPEVSPSVVSNNNSVAFSTQESILTPRSGNVTPNRSTARTHDTPVLFDVLPSMTHTLAHHQSVLPWGKAEANDAARVSNTAPSTPGVASTNAKTGLYFSSTNRLFLEVVRPLKREPTVERRIDIAVSWSGWCRASVTHRFRLRSVPLSSSATTVFGLAAQFLGFLSGCDVSCIPPELEVDGCGVPAKRCSHFYPLQYQLLLCATNSSSPGSSPAQQAVIPLVSLLCYQEQEGATTMREMRVADLLRMIRASPSGGSSGTSSSLPVVEVSMMLMPNTPMDIEESLRHHTNSLSTKSQPGISFASPLRWVDYKRATCFFNVVVCDKLTMTAVAPSGVVPASDTLAELNLWLDQLYPVRRRNEKKHVLALEVHVATAHRDIISGLLELPEVTQSKFWLPRDIAEYCKNYARLQDEVRQAGPGAAPAHAASDAVPSQTNHRKSSNYFLLLDDEDVDEYRLLIQRSVRFQQHLMSVSKNGSVPCPFELKKVMVLFPARLVVLQEDA